MRTRTATPNLTNPQLAKAFAHPVRVQALAILTERAASPKELAAAIGESVRHVAYHVDVLKRLNCIELQHTQPASGGRVVEHFYRAIRRPYFDAEAWEELSDEEKYGVVGTIMRLVSEDVAKAMQHGTFNDPDDNHISRTPLSLDREGWEETVALLDGTVDRLLEIQARSAGRLAKQDGDGDVMSTKVEILHFRSPLPSSAGL